MFTEDDVQILRDIRELIGDEKRWTKGAYARNELGNSVFPLDPEARCWCYHGAYQKVTEFDSRVDKKYIHFYAERLFSFGVVSVVQLNDRLSHPAFMAELNNAICELEAEVQKSS